MQTVSTQYAHFVAQYLMQQGNSSTSAKLSAMSFLTMVWVMFMVAIGQGIMAARLTLSDGISCSCSMIRCHLVLLQGNNTVNNTEHSSCKASHKPPVLQRLHGICNHPMPLTCLTVRMLRTGRAKGMMAERLAVSEGKLMKLHHDEVIKNLVAAKMELAQSQFETLEIQVSSTHTQQ